MRNERLLLWAVFAGYVLLLLMALAKHELWGDEIHSWNIARSSHDLIDLLRNSRYEGHPPLWYVVLFSITRITNEPEYMKIAQAVFAIAMVYVLLFASPFPLFIRTLIPFGYYFTFEYGALSRNYAIALVFAFLTTWVLTRKPRRHELWFYVLVFLLSNTHLLGLLLALSFCAYHAWEGRSAQGGYRRAIILLAIGVLICLPAAMQIAPPGESQLNMQFWMDHWTVQQWDTMAQAPLKAFVPIPDRDQFHFWNTNALLQRIPNDDTGRLVIRCCAAALMALLCFLLRKDRGSVLFIASNALLTAAVAFIFPLTSARYVGFIFIAFLIATWLHLHGRPLDIGHRAFLSVVLVLQVLGSVIAIGRDRTFPFSNSAKVRELHALVPANALVVTDYWCLNNLSAFLARPFYSLEHRREMSFLRWDQELAQASHQPNFYSVGLRELWERSSLKEVYMISVNDAERVQAKDSALSVRFDVALIAQYEGAIETRSNVYLYRIRARSDTD